MDVKARSQCMAVKRRKLHHNLVEHVNGSGFKSLTCAKKAFSQYS